MKKIYTIALFVFALSLVFTSCTKDDVYRPGGPDTELNAGEDGSIPIDPITEPDDDTEPHDDKGS